ncbi:cytochrome P450 [Amycolatopsis sp. NBC_00345]|uniref:cytochrome P450 n=1 Tax=Amycolatopsis sp. NBC_00345 TaxID=2975955 RepID=UPI002E25A762
MTSLNPALPQETGFPEFPMQRTCPFQPPPGYAELRAGGPLTRVALLGGRTAWVVTAHAVARTLLTDPRISSDWTDPAFPVLSPVRGVIQKQTVMIGMDAPDHTRYRRMVIPAFTARRINGLRETLDRIVDERLTELLAGPAPADLVDFAVSVPSIAICGLLGIPYDDHEFFETETRKLVLRTSAEEAGAALGSLQRFLDELIGRKLADPGEGLIDDLIGGPFADGRIDRPTMVQMCTLMLMAGHETTANVILLGLLTLLENPAEFAALRADPELVPGAVEELLRYLSVAETIPRVATGDVEVEGVLIRAGEPVLLANSAINRDGDAFPGPDRFDVRRAPRTHTGFGFGAHQCVGGNLARAELDIVFRALAARLPETVRLAVPAGEIRPKGPAGPQGIFSLPITW